MGVRRAVAVVADVWTAYVPSAITASVVAAAVIELHVPQVLHDLNAVF